MYEKVAIITDIWQSLMLFTRMNNACYLITVSNINKITTFFYDISQQTLNIYETIAIITEMWHRAKFYFTCISGPLNQIMVPNIKKIYPVTVQECTIMDRWTEGWMDG